jgi:hypothetical protein
MKLFGLGTASIFMVAAVAALCASLAAVGLSRLVRSGSAAIGQPTAFDAKLEPVVGAGN